MRCLLFIVIVFSLVFVACNAKQKPEDVAMQQISRLKLRYDSSLVKGDTAFLKTLYAEQYIHVNAEGSVLTKAQKLDNLVNSELKWSRASSNNDNVTIHGNSAVLISSLQGEGSFRGNPITIHERNTSLWIKQDTSWKLAAEHVSVIK